MAAGSIGDVRSRVTRRTFRALCPRHNQFLPMHFFKARNKAWNDDWNKRSTENDRSLPSRRRRHLFACEIILSAIENTRNCKAIGNTSSRLFFMHSASSRRLLVKEKVRRVLFVYFKICRTFEFSDRHRYETSVRASFKYNLLIRIFFRECDLDHESSEDKAIQKALASTSICKHMVERKKVLTADGNVSARDNYYLRDKFYFDGRSLQRCGKYHF
ncbi:hypothetical protein PUN28_014448 [Cardiocondyla obscurior]|uniref:Uncharacterized protein n=1 Tax=Cardiocondyla obscurior TaxID=286306 RepID=A0AAW2F3I4_9HYME